MVDVRPVSRQGSPVVYGDACSSDPRPRPTLTHSRCFIVWCFLVRSALRLRREIVHTAQDKALPRDELDATAAARALSSRAPCLSM
eukprot:scaffold126914_cov32-Tisochrysis_lutea.AAC.1